jgi:phospholipid transport system substrate-binding protein
LCRTSLSCSFEGALRKRNIIGPIRDWLATWDDSLISHYWTKVQYTASLFLAKNEASFGVTRDSESDGKELVMKRSQRLIFALIVLLSVLAPRSNASAETAKEQLQGTLDRVLQVLRTIRSAEDIEKNKSLFRQILLTRFDFAAMAQRTLGNRWNELAGREQEFIAAFTDFIEGAYMGTLGAYQGETIIYENDRAAGELAEVDTRVVGGRGAPIEVEYKLRRSGDEWKVYDVVIDDVSVISNYQSQFRLILQRASLQELIQRLQGKTTGG